MKLWMLGIVHQAPPTASQRCEQYFGFDANSLVPSFGPFPCFPLQLRMCATLPSIGGTQTGIFAEVAPTGLGRFRVSRSRDITNQAEETGYLPKVAGPSEGSAWVAMRDVQVGGRGAEDTALSMPQHMETYMFPLHLGVCILKFPSAVLGGCPRGLSLLGLMRHTHILRKYEPVYSCQLRNL